MALRRNGIGKVLGFFAMSLLGAALTFGQPSDEWLMAEGTGETPSEAVQDALRSVVERGVGIWVQAHSVMVNFDVKEDIVRTVAKGYVRRYELLEEKKEGELYWVRVRAKVADVLSDIDWHFSEAPALYQQLGEPRVLVLLDEQAVGQPLRDEHPAEFAVTGALLEENIRLVDKRQVEKMRQREVARALLGGDKKAAWEIGEETGAEILLAGTAKADRFGEFAGSEVQSCHARIELKAIWVDDGEVLAARRIEGVAAADFQLPKAARTALQKAGQKVIAEGFLALIVKAFALEAAKGRTVCLRLKGNYDDLMILLDIAEKYRDFAGAFRDEYSDEQQEGRIWVRVKGNPTGFVRWLLRQPFGRTRLEVIRKSATGREVAFRVR